MHSSIWTNIVPRWKRALVPVGIPSTKGTSARIQQQQKRRLFSSSHKSNNISSMSSSLTILSVVGLQIQYHLQCQTSTTITETANCEGKSKPIPPPRYGSTIPNNLLFLQHQRQRQRQRQRQPRRQLATETTSSAPSKPTSTIDINISTKENRNECVVCKKYSRGPCGEMFKKWLACIDNNSGNESICDEFILPLDKCLKENDEYYSNIDIEIDSHDDNNDNNNDYEKEEKEGTTSNIRSNNYKQWKEFIQNLESGSNNEVSITFKDFPVEIMPQMEIRLEKLIGVIEFRSRFGKDKLILGYAKDEKGNILAAASADELLVQVNEELDDSDDESEWALLRFQAPKGATQIQCYAIYIDTEIQHDTNAIIIYRRMHHLPPTSQ